MSNDKIDPSKRDAKISSADYLVKTGKSGDVELSEEELKRVTGGATRRSYEYDHGYGIQLTGKSVP